MKHFFLLVFIAVSSGLLAQEEVCNETWSGTILLDAPIVIPANCQVTVLAGSSVQSDFPLVVEGTFHAIGAEENPISITVGSLISRTTDENFVLENVAVQESIEFVTNYPNISELPLELTLADAGNVGSNWFSNLPSLNAFEFGDNTAIGEASQSFDNLSTNPWGGGLYYPGDYYFNSTSLSIQSENGDNYLAQGSPNIGCTYAAGTWNDLRASFSSPNALEKVTSIDFDYRLYSGAYNESLIIDVKTTPGCTYDSGDWTNLAVIQEFSGWQHFSFDVRHLDITAGCIRLRAYEPNQSGGNSCDSFYNRGDLDNFEIRSNLGGNSYGVSVTDHLRFGVSAGGMSLTNVSWAGSLDFACDGCVIEIINSTVNPLPELNPLVQSAIRVLGSGVNLKVQDTEILNFTSGKAIEVIGGGGNISTLELLRTDIHSCQVGLQINSGWTCAMTNTKISECNGDAVLASNESAFSVKNCTIANNGGYGILKNSPGFLQVESSIFWGNNPSLLTQIACEEGSVSLAFSDVSGFESFGLEGAGIAVQSGNFDQNPQWSSNYSLSDTSPCIDAGPENEYDAFRPPGRGGAQADIGWMGGEYVTSLGPFGCTDSLACNYSEVAISDNNSCIFPADFYDCEGHCLIDTDADGICDQNESQGADESACGLGTVWDPEIQQCVALIECPADVTGDGTISINDLMFILAFFGLDCQ